MPKFSIIISVFNAAKTLAETLHSIAEQTNTDWEVIAVNDGSTDNSAEIFTKITQNWQHAKLIHQENFGLGQARNVAAQQAVGQWLVFLDADDCWVPQKLSVLEKEITRNLEAQLFYHPVFEVNATRLLRQRKFWTINSTQEFIEKGNPFVPSAVAIKRELFLKNGGFIEDRNQVEDLAFWLKILHKKVKIHGFKKPLTLYRMGNGVTSDLPNHLEKVGNAIAFAQAQNFISALQKTQFLDRKNYEAARQLQKFGAFASAEKFYKQCQALSLKGKILRLANAVKISM